MIATSKDGKAAITIAMNDDEKPATIATNHTI
jgi:hypothetical protein